MTSYIVLSVQSDGTFDIVGNVDAGSTESACRKVAEELETEGNYVAVPRRSFNIVPVKFTTIRRAVVGARSEQKAGLTA